MRILDFCTFLMLSLLPLPALSQGIPFRCNFENDKWYEAWGGDSSPRNTCLVFENEDMNFKPFDGKALMIKVENGGHYGASFDFDFSDQWNQEPEEIYFRYYLRFAGDWNPERGGKLPGIAGTYGRAGWGGRPVHGDDGWSARGLFQGLKDGKTPIGFYCYHMDMQGQYGSSWVWNIENRGYLENNRWYCVEQYVKLNDVGKSNGILRGWIDDKLAFEKTDLLFRSTDSLKIENVWINVYLGGKWTSKSEHHLFIDNIVISTFKIGPEM